MGDFELECLLGQERADLNRLRSLLDVIAEDGEYDAVVIDCPPYYSVSCLSALAACDSIIIPADCSAYSTTGMAGLVRQIAVKHDGQAMEAELNAMVDQGCTVLDVIVDHPIYGQLTGPLQLSDRYQVGQFIARCRSQAAAPLSQLTEGIHLHTLACPDQGAYERVREALARQGILLER